MKAGSALSHLKEGELCIVTTPKGEFEARWSVASWCFYHLDRGTPVVLRAEEIEEWRPVTVAGH